MGMFIFIFVLHLKYTITSHHAQGVDSKFEIYLKRGVY